jgi:tripartite-type tricarboxylate transporter receptor subunit TctC
MDSRHFGRRRFLQWSAVTTAAGAFMPAVFAQAYPSKPIRYIVGFAPGGTSDLVARLINPLLAARLGQPVVIENIPSAGGVVATGALAKAAPDGYTVMHTSNAFLTVTPHLIKVPYDPLQDLEPIAFLGSSVQILCVHPALPVKNVAEFIAYAKANPGKLNYGSSGTATGNHITCEYMKRAAGFDAVHVPYKGAAPAIQDLIGGRVQFMTDPALLPHIQAGKVRPLGVVDASSHPMMPDLPPLSATIPNWNPPQWYNFLSVPAKTPADVKEKLERAVREVMTTSAVKEKLGENSFVAEVMSPDELRTKVRTEFATMGELLKAAQIQLS